MTSTALMATGNFGVHIPMPICNNVAWLQDRNEDLNFDHEEMINELPRLVYKPMGPFMTDVCGEEVADETHQCDNRWSSMEGTGWWSPSPVEIVLTVGGLCQSFLHIWHLHSTKLRCRLNLPLFFKKDYFLKKEPDFF
jgi:hypothetical protein